MGEERTTKPVKFDGYANNLHMAGQFATDEIVDICKEGAEHIDWLNNLVRVLEEEADQLRIGSFWMQMALECQSGTLSALREIMAIPKRPPYTSGHT